MVVEVDVQPLAAGGARLAGCDRNELGGDALVLSAPGHERVEDEGVHRAVPRDVHEPHELIVVVRAHPSEAVPLELRAPVVVEDAMVEALGVQSVRARRCRARRATST